MTFQELTSLLPSIFGAVSERQKRFRTPESLSCFRNGEHVFGLEVLPSRTRGFGKRAIRTGIQTQGGERNEDFPRIGDGPPGPLVPEPLRLLEQGHRIDVAPGECRSLVAVGGPETHPDRREGEVDILAVIMREATVTPETV